MATATEFIEQIRRMIEDHGDAEIVMAQDESVPVIEFDADAQDFVIS